ncbi:hypothetical protein [Micromonospora echinaurantiaca]|uniref:hypothetical protein n=1 Tax=Micromonospora echinaurantiaca TaxID=47857 RepID=UPI000B5B0084|nr:hypothetical protein [Micromonospora echinaurantiaca]
MLPEREGGGGKRTSRKITLGRSRGALTTKINLACAGVGRPVIADKGYDSKAICAELRRRAFGHTIPARCRVCGGRLAGRRRDGRPPVFDKELYKRCNCGLLIPLQYQTFSKSYRSIAEEG